MSIQKQLSTFILAMLFAISTNALAAGSQADFPSKITGKWRLNLQKLNSNGSDACLEIHVFKLDGSNFVWTPSTDSTTEGNFSIADRPTEKGFFTYAEKLTKTNGKANCDGISEKIGDESKGYIYFKSDNLQFYACQNEEMSENTCTGPFIKIKVNGSP